MTFDYYPSPFERQSRLASLRSPIKKRKRRPQDEASEENDEPGLGIAKGDSPDTNHHGNASFASEHILQDEVAGEPLEPDALPKGFPHRAIGRPPSSKAALTPKQIQHELLQLRPPLFSSGLSTADGSQSNASLKQSVIASLTMIMHRCLLQGDFSRAGRAFGMLIRTEVGGQQPDLRRNKLWGIGAEILLRKNEEHPAEAGTMQEPIFSDSPRLSKGPRAGDISDSSFQLAKQYYERLILEYPYNQWHPHTFSNLHFQPLIFSLWISIIYNEHLLSQPSGASARHQNDSSDSDFDEAHLELSEHERQLEVTRAVSYEKAQQVLTQIDEALTMFPYSEDATLWRLKGNLHLWMSDLLPRLNQGSRSNSPVGQSTSMESPYSAPNELDGWREHGQKAQGAFTQARDRVKDSFGSGQESHGF